MRAFEFMKDQVIKVKETDSVRSVIEKFIEHGISGLPVVNEANEIVAYISDGDIMRYIGKHKDIFIDTIFFVDVIKGDDINFEERLKKVLDLNVTEIAKKTVLTIPWNEEIENIAALLGKKQIKKLPVVRKGVLVGIISRGDVIRHSFKSVMGN
ncbi:CBS domain-containing protein [Bacillus niacini]|uniref:CBS domain-containing protein n=1 Tax=Neobacillus niacini TaxID=86668 RepID=A0A852TKP0_9BACI|nr:CBS domain-containing protein [Neobacillus niacini]NYE09590.1 CBS domain-containing protein [Neobacillus niacini]